MSNFSCQILSVTLKSGRRYFQLVPCHHLPPEQHLCSSGRKCRGSSPLWHSLPHHWLMSPFIEKFTFSVIIIWQKEYRVLSGHYQTASTSFHQIHLLLEYHLVTSYPAFACEQLGNGMLQSTDFSTLYQLRNLINRRNVLTKPEKDVSASEDFVLLMTECHTVSSIILPT